MIKALFGRQDRYGRLQGIKAKILFFGHGYLPSFDVKAVSFAHIAGAMPFDFVNTYDKVIKLKLIISEFIFFSHVM
jgi:hypothetical protein